MARFKRWFLRRNETYDDLSGEIRQHLTEKVDSLMAEGMGRAEAELAARREFGNITSIEETGREVWRWPMVDSLCSDLTFALRQMRKDRGFAFAAILTVALGIGATTAVFSLVNAVLLRPLPFPEPDRLMWAAVQDHSLPGGAVAADSLSYPDYFDWRAQNRTLSGLASFRDNSVILRMAGSEPRMLNSQIVSSNLFDVLGTSPQVGRTFRAEDEKRGGLAVMLSDSLWRSSFGARPDIAGTTIRLGDKDFTVAGVMPRSFRFPLGNPAPDLWLSIGFEVEGKEPPTVQRGFNCLELIGRLKPGITVEQAKADLSRIASNLAREYSETDKRFTSALVEPELRHLTGDVKPLLRLLFAAVTLLLLIACSNVAGLLLARGSRRSAEFALRASLGASRATIVRQLLVESVVLSICGGVAGTALGYALLTAMAPLMPASMPRVDHLSINGTVLGFVIALSVATGLLFGILPAWRMSETRPEQALREGSRSVTGGRNRRRIHSVLVVAQTAISLLLLVSSGLLIRSFVRILNVDAGFDPQQVLTARIGVSFDKLSHDQHLALYDGLLSRLSVMPGVQSASAGWPLPMTDYHASVSLSIAGRETAKGDEPSEALSVVLPDYFAVMRIPLLAGRSFGERDTTHAAPVMIVNQAFARKYFPNEDPLGKRIRVSLGDGVVAHPWREVVGVVGDIRQTGLTQAADPQYYLPYSQALVTNPYLVIRIKGQGDPALLERALRAAVYETDRSVPLYQVSKLETFISQSASHPRFQALLVTGFAVVALLLAAVGLYGLLSYMVAERTLEIGVRMALGASKADMLSLVARQGVKLTGAGLVVGLVLSAVATRLFAEQLFEVSPRDVLTFAVTTLVLFVVSLAASSIPAYRAARVEPVRALRT